MRFRLKILEYMSPKANKIHPNSTEFKLEGQNGNGSSIQILNIFRYFLKQNKKEF